MFESGDEGIVFDLDVDSIGVVLLTDRNGIRAGDTAYKTERIASVNATEVLLGRVLDALGNPIDNGPELKETISYPVKKMPLLCCKETLLPNLFIRVLKSLTLCSP